MKNKKAFTLVELMIVIVIMVLMMTLSYAPYNYYQQKAKLRIASREISQSLYEAKNFAISWVETKSGSSFSNSSIWVFLDNTEGENHQIYFYTYPYNTQTWTLVSPKSSTSTSKLFKTKKLQDWVLINGTWSILFFYESITWNPTILEFIWTNKRVIDESVDIKFSYKDSSSPKLQKTINYNLKTNTVNYK